MNLIPVGILPLEEAKILQRTLASKGVKVELNHNEETCRSGGSCAITVEVHAPEESVEAAVMGFKEMFKSLSEGQKVDWALIDNVYDPTQEKATCPACGESFSTSSKDCPGCGLCF